MSLLKAKGVEYMLSFLRLPQAHVSPSISEAVNAAASWPRNDISLYFLRRNVEKPFKEAL